MFDTFMGLPVHVLVLHFTVVLVPLSAFATIAVAVRSELRAKFAAPLAGLNLVMLILTFVTVRAGLDFKDRFAAEGDTETPKYDHETFGKALLWIMVALAIASIGVLAASRKSDLAPSIGMGLGGVVALLAVASIVLTVITGHTGSESNWKDFVKYTDKKLSTPAPK